MRPFLGFILLAVVPWSTAGCAVGIASGMPQRAPAAMEIAMLERVEDVSAAGNALAGCIGRSVEAYRPQLRNAKADLAISGGIAAAIGTIGATLAGVFKPQDTKTGIGVGSAILGAMIGGYQVYRGVDRDPTGYVQNGGALTARYGGEIIDATTDEEKRAAVRKLFEGAASLQQNYPEYADFRLTDPYCDR
jgi:hypothetical protein